MMNKTSSLFFLSTAQVGERFLEYYKGLGYANILGSPLLDASIPMSFVMSAGMVQFERMAGKKRGGDHFALIQNCFRYFDLERIGESGLHLSLFQMPGAFDFGPVDRQRTVDRILNLLTGIYGLDPACLAVTYFGGGEVDSQYLPSDVETALAWQKAGIPAERIYASGAESNFWSQTKMAVGPNVSRKRGPNTEVFYDRGEAYDCSSACKPGCPCGRYVEFLNTLFITLQFDPASRQLVDIEEPFTEVVIGQERLAMILQAKASVFETDAILSLVQQLRCFSKPLPDRGAGAVEIRADSGGSPAGAPVSDRRRRPRSRQGRAGAPDAQVDPRTAYQPEAAGHFRSWLYPFHDSDGLGSLSSV
jgi:alanyl-tRNA synthetase